MPDHSSEQKQNPWKLTRLEAAGIRGMARADPTFDGTFPAEAPKDPALRPKWVEAVGGHPLAAADRFRAERRGEEGDYDGDRWWVKPDGPTLDLVRDGATGPDDDLLSDPISDPISGPVPDPADHEGAEECLVDDDVLPPLPDDLARDALRPKWEAFARLYAYGHSAADAARFSGYAWHRAAQSGWRLLQDERIRNRVDQLTRHLYGSEAWDAPAFVTRLEAIYREAMHRGQYTAAVRAVEAAARIESRKIGSKERRRNDHK